MLTFDGGSFMGPYQDPQGSPEGSSSSSKVKEKVLAWLDQLAVLPGLRDMHKPNFIYLLKGDREWDNFPHAPPSFSLRFSFLISEFASHLESIWPIIHPQTWSCSLPGLIQHTGGLGSVWMPSLAPTFLWNYRAWKYI